jgi:hypothetical protein
LLPRLRRRLTFARNRTHAADESVDLSLSALDRPIKGGELGNQTFDNLGDVAIEPNGNAYAIGVDNGTTLPLEGDVIPRI